MYLSEQATLQVGLETTPGTDPTLTGTAGIFARNISLDPSQGSYDDAQKANADFGADADIWSGKNQTISFDVPLAGSGVAGTAPGWGIAMQACDWLETVTAATKVEYTTKNYNPAAAKSVSIYYNKGGLKFLLTLCRGTASFVFDPNKVPLVRFAMTCLWAKPAAVPLPDVKTAVEAFNRGIEMNKANTTFSLHGVTPVLESLSIDQGNQVQFYDRPNGASVDITKRTPSGKASFEYPAIGTLDVMDRAANNTLGAMALVHGTVAGNIIKVDAPLVQIKQPKLADVSGKIYCSADLGIIRAATGNGDLKITVQ